MSRSDRTNEEIAAFWEYLPLALPATVEGSPEEAFQNGFVQALHSVASEAVAAAFIADLESEGDAMQAAINWTVARSHLKVLKLFIAHLVPEEKIPKADAK